MDRFYHATPSAGTSAALVRGPGPDLRCHRDACRRDPAARLSEEGPADRQDSCQEGEEAGRGVEGGAGQGDGSEEGNGRTGAAKQAPGQEGRRRRKKATGGTATPATARSSCAGRPADHVHDVVVVGAGPTGSSCGFWLADAGWDVVVVEKKTFPREKTCGDGLTPRAVRQLADMGLEGALAGSHRYTRAPGLRLRPLHRDAVARAPALPRLRLHDHPPRPRRTGGGARRPRRARPCSRAPRSSHRDPTTRRRTLPCRSPRWPG